MTQRSSGSALEAILNQLASPGVTIDRAEQLVPATPGLYAIHADQPVWVELGLGRPDDLRPLYVGKSESSLHGRDVVQHFSSGRTGTSTLRRSIAALLHDSLKLRGMPRNPAKPGYFSNYGLSPRDDEKLTEWMRSDLRLTWWQNDRPEAIITFERAVLDRLLPPLNLADVSTEWSVFLSRKRSVMAAEARRWAEKT